MREFSRRSMLRAGAGLGIAGLLPQVTLADGEESPDLEKFKAELPVPEKREPDGKRRGADYHEVEIKEAQHKFHPDLGETTIWGFDGQFPGPIIEGRRNERLAVEFDNSALPDEHLFEVDERIGGTTTENYVGYDGDVPEVRNSTHVHGLNIDPDNDGQADQWSSPDGVTGPRFADDVHELPNRQSRLTSSYHDHTRGISRLNNYAGLIGPYYIRSQQEEQLDLPEGEYDVPLVLADRAFDEDGELKYPDEFVANFAGDVATVNGAAWPFMEVEPRKYRFRIINLSNGRTYDLGLKNEDASDDEHNDVPTQYQISPGHGFLEEVVSIGHHGDMESLTIAPFERAEIIVDFSDYAGETITVTNDAMFPYNGGMGHDDDEGDDGHEAHGDMDGMDTGGDDGMDHDDDGMDCEMDHGGMDHPQIHEIMQFRVKDSVSEEDTSTHPTDLTLPNRNGPNPKAARTTREMTMEMGMDDNCLMIHTLNGKRWGDGIDVKPQLGSTEIWELVNDDDHTHPIHLHLVEFEVIEREWHDKDEGPRPPHPNERGGKDVVRVNPGETVRIAVKFENYTGKFPFHCHILEHEEHDMMRMFEVVAGDGDEHPGKGRGHGDDHPGKGRGHDDGHPGKGRGHDGDNPGKGPKRGDDHPGRGNGRS